jgi:AraC-like DNA-binding protein
MRYRAHYIFNRSEFCMDTLSDVLSLLKPQSYAAAGFDLGGDWAIQFPAHDGIKGYAIASGHGWLAVQGEPPVFGSAGDCFLLPRGLPFRVARDLSLTPMAAEDLYAMTPEGGLTTHMGGGNCSGVVANFYLTGPDADILLEMLPPIIHVRNDSDKAVLRWSVERMMAELRDPQPGSVLILQQLATMMLVQALRLHIAEKTTGVGWLFALGDKRMAAAIGAMHADPARRWSLQSLAEEAGMSRTIFAVKFKAMVGVSAMDYLTRWRMRLAGDRLINGRETLATIGLSLGYESESAFSAAFKRTMGCSPRQYGRSEPQKV